MENKILSRKFGVNELGFADLPDKISLKRISQLAYMKTYRFYNKRNWKNKRKTQYFIKG